MPKAKRQYYSMCLLHVVSQSPPQGQLSKNWKLCLPGLVYLIQSSRITAHGSYQPSLQSLQRHEYRPYHLVTCLFTVEWKSRVCGPDDKGYFQKMQGARSVRIPGLVRLVEHALSWNRNQPSVEAHRSHVNTLLPVSGSLLQPSYPTEEDMQKLTGIKQCQKHYYNRWVKPLEPINVGDTICM